MEAKKNWPEGRRQTRRQWYPGSQVKKVLQGRENDQLKNTSGWPSKIRSGNFW